MKDRVRAFFAIIIIPGLCSLSFYLGGSIFKEYFSVGDEIVFSWLTVALVALPFVMIFPLVYFILVLFKGKEFAFRKIDYYVVYLKWGCIAIVVPGLLYSILYPKELISRGYVRCNGIPSGWMPGTATRYVKERFSCKPY
ncbi:hypothetical protein [Candidatus Pantoea rara]|uniref:hypothetical protein n=1 Tax=Candidatus Pantoea rara TaxID=1947037 RepID=UPI003EBCDD9D